MTTGPNGLQQRGQRLLAGSDRRGEAFQPQHGGGFRLGQTVEPGGDVVGQMGGAGDVEGRAHGRGHGGAGPRIVETIDQHGRLGFRLGQHLERDIGHGGERAPGAGDQLAEVVAGDVLDHAAAGFDGLGAAGDRD